MSDFLIKSTITLFALLAVYYLFLEKEKIHVFNRFYLLFSIVFSMVLPFITIEVIQEIAQPTVNPGNILILQGSAAILEETNYLVIGIWSLYAVVTLVLAIRFFSNIITISSKMKMNTPIEYKNAKLILVPEKTLPHTFLNTIFINETEYNNREIEAELYTHELTHVTQKHTLDILFIELLKTIFWFNPIFIFYKKAIQLNHEFLADEKVVNAYNNVPFYQSLLLSKANENQTFYLASNLNYLITKKRLLMMTKTTSKSKAILKKIILLPCFTGLILLLCVESIAQEKQVNNAKSNAQNTISDKQKRDSYYSGVRLIVKDKNKKILIDKKYEELSLEEKKRFLFYLPTPSQKKSPSKKEFESWKNEKNGAFWIDGKNIPNSTLNRYKADDIASFSKSFIYKNARTKKHPQEYQYNLYTHNYFNSNLKNAYKKFPGKEINITVMGKKKVKEVAIKMQPNKAKATTKTDIYNTAGITTKPDFPGGIMEFYKFVGNNFKTPKQPNLKGKVYITFVIEKDGSLSDIKNIRDIGFGTGEEAIRVLKTCPNWIPGKLNGVPVRVMYSLPITIQSKS